jgi:hypothetical protein
MRRPAEDDNDSSFGTAIRSPALDGTPSSVSNLPESGGGRALGGATRRVASASEARAARLNALEKRQEQQEGA